MWWFTVQRSYLGQRVVATLRMSMFLLFLVVRVFALVQCGAFEWRVLSGMGQ